MSHLNIEIKARTDRADEIKALLEANKARFVGVDHQIDTYFVVPKGRLKLRQGKIEKTLIHYHRPNQSGPKQSKVTLHHPTADESLKEVLENALDTLVVVDKQRAIYFIDNVKFHIDEVQGLGEFVEIEAIDHDGTVGLDHLHDQCEHFLHLLGIRDEDLVDQSYSDLLLG
ncbi:class IV adenylate cyclase [Flavilitoribacter nigricans]|uniref:Adenylate cyclase n=1 Tax=Flavilitoribacter nigricans (strain ATCC 23147 / DSM 23189 / NBRC 102662 / NCIMB 1420 / SS-2) TaxID=1122177 RepID=A0A2D0N667_FLAN2|nr:class IV adenylate cyclase [Flavilitoribacter nigricans]PHN03273.1 adenylate cyclase [Flavilitoribacter nigricans DSM 23189 = NBRC 102662]